MLWFWERRGSFGIVLLAIIIIFILTLPMLDAKAQGLPEGVPYAKGLGIDELVDWQWYAFRPGPGCDGLYGNVRGDESQVIAGIPPCFYVPIMRSVYGPNDGHMWYQVRLGEPNTLAVLVSYVRADVVEARQLVPNDALDTIGEYEFHGTNGLSTIVAREERFCFHRPLNMTMEFSISDTNDSVVYSDAFLFPVQVIAIPRDVSGLTVYHLKYLGINGTLYTIDDYSVDTCRSLTGIVSESEI